MDNRPIGIFDSGVGGISIWKEIKTKLPSEDTLYLADSKNAPYGEKTPQEILDLSVKNTEWLLEKDCKLIAVACNTATTNAIDHLRAHYPVPFIGIEPAIKPAALGSASGKVGVLATRGTLSSRLFHSTSRNHASHIEILEQEGRGLVELIEQGKALSGETRSLIRTYVQPMVAAGIDHLVLGCTHYPHLIPLLKEELPEGIRIIDCGEAVAKQTLRVLEKHDLLSSDKEETTHHFYSNANHELLSRFLQGEAGNIRVAYLDF